MNHRPASRAKERHGLVDLVDPEWPIIAAGPREPRAAKPTGIPAGPSAQRDQHPMPPRKWPAPARIAKYPRGAPPAGSIGTRRIQANEGSVALGRMPRHGRQRPDLGQGTLGRKCKSQDRNSTTYHARLRAELAMFVINDSASAVRHYSISPSSPQQAGVARAVIAALSQFHLPMVQDTWMRPSRSAAPAAAELRKTFTDKIMFRGQIEQHLRHREGGDRTSSYLNLTGSKSDDPLKPEQGSTR